MLRVEKAGRDCCCLLLKKDGRLWMWMWMWRPELDHVGV